MKTIRVVRFVLLRGPDMELRDKNGKSALDMVADLTADDHIKNDLSRMLGPPGKLDCLMLTPPNRLTHKNPCTMGMYLTALISTHLILAFLVYPRTPWPIDATEFLLFILCLLFLLLTNCTKPGYITNEVDFYDLVRVIDAT